MSAATGEFLLRLKYPCLSLLDCEDPQPLELRLPAPSTPSRSPRTSFAPSALPCPLGAPLPQKLSASSPGGSFRSAAREQGAAPLAIASCGASAADPASAPGSRVRPWRRRSPARRGLPAPVRPSGAPSDCGAARPHCRRGALQPFSRRRPPAGPGAAGAAPPWGALLSRPARRAASPAARRTGAGVQSASAASAFPSPCRPPLGSPGGGVSLRARPPPAPSQALPSPARPYVCVTARRARPLARPPTYLSAAPEGARRAEDARGAAQGLSLSTLAGRHLTRVPGGSGRLSASLPQAGRYSATQTPPLRPPPEGTCGQDAGRRRGAQRLPRASPPRRGQTRASRPQVPPLSRQVYGTEVLGEGSPTLEGNRLLPSRGRLSQRAWRAGGDAVAPPLCRRLRCLGLPLSREACAADPRHPPAAPVMDLGKLSGCCRLSVDGAREHVMRGSCLPVPRMKEERAKEPSLQTPICFQVSGSGRSCSGQSSCFRVRATVREPWVPILLGYF